MIRRSKIHKQSAHVAVADTALGRASSRATRAADGQFWYSVLTTAGSIATSCPSRTDEPPKRPAPRTLEEGTSDRLPAVQRCIREPLYRLRERRHRRTGRVYEESEEAPSLTKWPDAVVAAQFLPRCSSGPRPGRPRIATAPRARRCVDVLRERTVTRRSTSWVQLRADALRRRPRPVGMDAHTLSSAAANEDSACGRTVPALGALLVASSKKGVASIMIRQRPRRVVRNLRIAFPRRS